MRDGRNSRLVFLARDLQQQHVGFLLATETRIENDVHTKHACGYDIFCTYTSRKNQGGLALFTRADPKPEDWHIESPR